MKLLLPKLVRIAILLLIPTVMFGQKVDYIVHFNSGNFSPVENASRLTKDSTVFTNSFFKDNYFVTIQFLQLPNDKEKKDLLASGVELIDYISGNSYTASIRSNFNITSAKRFQVRSFFQIQEDQKISPDIASGKIPQHAINTLGFVDVNVITYKLFKLEDLRQDFSSLNITVLEDQPMFRTIVLRVPAQNLIALAKLPFVQWVETIDPPNVAENLPGRSLHGVNVLGDGPRNLQGSGIKIGVWDGGPTDISHPDFGPVGRVTLVENNPPITDHGTHVTGTVGGAGILDPFARGMAPKARIYSYDFTTGTVSTEINSALSLFGINISSHSYGQSTTGLTCATVSLDYSTTSRNTDINLNNYPYHLHVHSSGNSQGVCPDGFRTITGSGKSAKNNLVVGNITSLEVLSGSSSAGPVLDGRLKPEISAMGTSVYSTMPDYGYASMSGTSMATPGVSGTLALVVERFKQLNSDVNPNSSLIKAIACNTAKDLGNAGPDYRFGYGGINGLKAVKTIEDGRFTENSISTGETKNVSITVPAGATGLKVMLSWNDPAATAASAIALINNLNLSVSNGSTLTLPWVLDKDNPANLATRGVDNLNNMEQVTIDNPAPGNYTFIVNGASIPVGPQTYSLTWEIESPALEVTYPSGGESFDPGTSETITWNNTGVTGNQTVEYSIDNGISWTTISSTVPASTTRLIWAIPASISSNQALIRVSAGSLLNISNIFNIVGTPKNLNLATNGCVAGALTFSWTAVTNATNYDVLRLDNYTGNFSVVGSNVTTTTFTSTGLTPGLNYSFTVIAKNNLLGWASRRPAAITKKAPSSTLSAIGSISGPATICTNSPGIVYSVVPVTGATLYTWTAPSGVTIVSGNGTNSIVVNFSGQSESGNFSVFASNSECQTATTTFSVTVAPFTLTPANPTICGATPVVLTADVVGLAGTTFSWSPASGLNTTTGAMVSANPSVPTTYTVTATNPLGCNTSLTTTVYIGDGPNAITSNAPICEGGDLTLFTSPISGAQKYLSVKFSEVTQFRNGIGGTPLFPNYVQVPSNNEDFVEITNVDNANSVDVSGLEFEVWLGSDLIRTYTIPSAVVIPPNEVMLLHIGNNGGPNNAQFRYFNTGGTNNPLASANPVGYLLKSGSTIVDAVATNSYAWPASSGVTAADWSGSMPSTSGLAGAIRTQATDNNTAADWSVSSAAQLQSLGTFNASASYTNVSPYNWTGPVGFASTLQNPVRPSITAAMAGTYTVTFAGTNACGAASLNTMIAVGPSSIPAITASSNNPSCFGTTLNLSVTTVPSATYAWTGPNGFTSMIQNPTVPAISNVNVGTYTVTVSLSGCSRTASTIVSTIELNGIYSVGPSGDFSNLTTAVAAYNNATCLSGPVVFELMNTYTSGSEVYPISILNHASASAVNTLTVRPATGATPTIIGVLSANSLIRFDGARYINFDGRQGGLGTDRSLTLDNTSNSSTAGTGVFTFINGAEFNGISYANILSANANSSTSPASASIMFRTTNTAKGNSNNSISKNYLSTSSSGTQARTFINCDGTAATPNSDNIIDGNELRAPISRAIALHVGLGNNWTISNNSIYWPGGTLSVLRMINMNNANSSGHTISGNFIGGTSAGATGTATPTSASSNNWWGMDLTLGNAFTTTISNNIVRGVSSTAPTPTTTYNVVGIAALAGKYNITGNTVSGLTSTVSGAASTLIAGILYQNTVATTGSSITNNTIFDITNNNASATNTAVYAIATILSANETIDISQNKIYNVRMPATTSTGSNVYGLFIQGVGNGGAVNVSNNMISLGQNVLNNVAVHGLFNFNTAPNLTATFNSVTIGGTGTGANNSSSFFRSGAANSTVVNLKNNIFNNTRSGGTGKHYAIMNNHTTPATGWVAATSNYNNLNTAAAAALGLWGSTDRTFATWLTSSAGDANSKNIAPTFQNATIGDLSILPVAQNCQLENSALAGTGITVDYFNTTRNATPTIGAHELASASAAPSAPVSGGNQIVCAENPVQTLTAMATVPSGVSMVWYDAPTLGNIVASPTLNTVGNIIYYAEAVSQSCAGNTSSVTRTAVMLTINGAPAAPTGGGNQIVCATSPIQTLSAQASVPSGHTVIWYDEPANGNVVTNPILNSIGTTTYYAASKNNTSGCESQSRLAVSLTINGAPVAPVSNGDAIICAGSPIPTLSVTTGLGVTVQWFANALGGTSLSSGNSFTPAGAGTYYAEASFTSTGCKSTSRTGVTLTINPIPTVNMVSNVSVCNGASTTAINFTGSVSGTVYNWTNSNTAIGLPASGSNSIPSFVGINAGTTPVSATVTVTPTYTFGGLTCTGSSMSFTITVNPIPNVVATQSAQTICSGAAIATMVLTGNVSGTLFSWTRSNTATVTGIAASGSGDITGSLTNTTNAPVTVTFTITPSANGCTGAAITTTVLVNPTATVTAVTNQVVCNGSPTTAVAISSPTTGGTIVYNWTNNTTSIGLPASGTGNIASFVGTNATTAPVTATITVTPTYTNGGVSCDGTARTFTITINPTPTVTQPTSQTVCTGAMTAAVTFTGAVAGTTYQWTNNNTATGLAASGTGNIAAFTTTNTTTGALVSTITVTPVFTNGGVSCTGTPATFTITVNPVVNITCPANMVLTSPVGSCAAVATYSPTVVGIPAPAITYSFSGATTGSGAGSGSGASFNVGVTTVTLTATNSCGTKTCSFTVTVNDGQLPVITAQPTTRSACESGNTTLSVTATNAVSYQWEFYNGTTWVSVAGATASTYTVTNLVRNSNTNTYRVRVIGRCTTITSTTATIFVLAKPQVSIVSNQALLIPGSNFVLTAVTDRPAGTGSYVWFKNGVIIPGATGASLPAGNINDRGTYKVTYTDANGCVNTSADFEIGSIPTMEIFVYPNPSNGQFQIRYYNAINERPTIYVYNSAGQVVFQNRMPASTEIYARLDVNISNLAAGTYMIKLIGVGGKILGSKQIVKSN